MKKTYLSIFALVLVFIMALGSVSAADNATTGAVDDSSTDSDLETTDSNDDSSDDSGSDDDSGDVETDGEDGAPLLGSPLSADGFDDSSADNEDGNSDGVDLSIKAGNPLVLLALSLFSIFVIPLRK